MAIQYSDADADPLHHAANIGRRLEGLTDHLREDLSKFKQPKVQALFETSAEVLKGARTAFEHNENQSEPAMREA